VSRASVPENAQCAKRGCTDRSTVILDRDRRAYCRPHGLAEALRRPRSEIRPIPEEMR
jgi:hypothetical protein